MPRPCVSERRSRSAASVAAVMGLWWRRARATATPLHRLDQRSGSEQLDRALPARGPAGPTRKFATSESGSTVTVWGKTLNVAYSLGWALGTRPSRCHYHGTNWATAYPTGDGLPIGRPTNADQRVGTNRAESLFAAGVTHRQAWLIQRIRAAPLHLAGCRAVSDACEHAGVHGRPCHYFTTEIATC